MLCPKHFFRILHIYLARLKWNIQYLLTRFSHLLFSFPRFKIEEYDRGLLVSGYGGAPGSAGNTQLVLESDVKVATTSVPNAAGFGGAVDNRGSAVRLFFPETWLWDLVPV